MGKWGPGEPGPILKMGPWELNQGPERARNDQDTSRKHQDVVTWARGRVSYLTSLNLLLTGFGWLLALVLKTLTLVLKGPDGLGGVGGGGEGDGEPDQVGLVEFGMEVIGFVYFGRGAQLRRFSFFLPFG